VLEDVAVQDRAPLVDVAGRGVQIEPDGARVRDDVVVLARLEAAAAVDRLPVVIASGYDRGERNRDLPNDANTRFLQKPFATTALLASVTGLLD
jgi:hypothetical protein